MPNQQPLSSSALADERDDYPNYTTTEKEVGIEEQTEAPNQSQDLYYGTQELLDSIPRVWTSGVLYVLIGFAVAVLPWSVLFKVDETGSARGRIEPQGATLKLDFQAGGKVEAVMVKEGEKVLAGQVLLKLDTNIFQTEIEQAKHKLSGLQTQKAQLDVLKNQIQLMLNAQQQQNQSQALEKISQVKQAKEDLETKQSSYNLQKLEKQALISQLKQQIRTSNHDQKIAKSRLSIDSRQVQRFSKLVNDGAVSANQIDQLKKEEQESIGRYEKAKSDVKQAQLRLVEEQNRYQTTINKLESDIKQSELRLQEEQNSYHSLLQAGKLAVLRNQQQLKDLQVQIAAVQSQIVQTTSQIASLKLQYQQRIVRSPVDGTIFELPVNKPEAVVQPGQRIVQIAPQNTELILKAQMPIQDSGFLKVGMPVKVKFDAYPFQEYGIVPGKVTWISPDSRINQTPQGNTENFELNIALEQQYIQNGKKRIPLAAGQTATAEVIIRQRRLIDFVLDPFKKLQKGGLEM
jgi:HlyD family secretion protein